MATTAHDGSVFHAGTPDGSPNARSATGRWMVPINAACASVRSPANASRAFAGSIKNSVPVPLPVGYWCGTNAVPSTLSLEVAGDVAQLLAFVGREGGHEDEADDVRRAGGGVADHGAAVGVPDREHWTGDLVEHAGDVGAVDGDAAQRVGGGHHLDAVRLQPLDDAGPARAVGEGAVHEHDGQREM